MSHGRVSPTTLHQDGLRKMRRIWSSVIACLALVSPLAADDVDFRQGGTTQLVLDPYGYRTRVGDLEFSPNGQLLVAAGEKEVRIYDTQAGQLVQTLRGDRSETPYGNVDAVVFTPDGRELLVGIDDFSDAGSIRVYDTRDFSQIQELAGGMHVPIRKLAFSRDGKYLVAAGENGNMYVWDWPARRIVLTIPVEVADQPIYSVLTFPTTQPILFALAAAGPRLYSIPDGKRLSPRDQLPPELVAWMRAFSSRQFQVPAADASYLPTKWELLLDKGLSLAAGDNRTVGNPSYWVCVFGANATTPATTYLGHKWSLTTVAAHAGSDLAASGDKHGEVHVWNRRTGKLLHRFQSLAQKFYEVSFDQSNSRLAFGTNFFTGTEYRRNHYGPAEFTLDLAARAIGDARLATGLVTQEEFTVAGNFEVKLEKRGDDIYLVSYQGGREHAKYRIKSGRTPSSYTLLKNHGFDIPHPVIFGDDEGVLACWDADTDRLHRSFTGHGQMVTSLGTSADGKLLVSCATDGEICIFPLTGREPTGDFDFVDQSDRVVEVRPGSSSARAGVQVGDRMITFDGKTISEIENLMMLGQWEYKPGQQVPMVMERNGQRYNYNMTLIDGPDLVQPLLHVFVTADREWIIWTQQGYYDASPGADRLIGWHVNRGPDRAADFHAVQQFRKQLYRPDIIDQVIQLGNVEQAIAAANAALGRPVEEIDLRDPDQFDKLHPPIVEFVAPAAGAISDAETITVEVRVSSPNQNAVREVTFLLDGNPAKVEKVNGGANGEQLTLSVPLTLSLGPHVVGVVASNGQTTSPLVTRRVSYRGGVQPGQRDPLPKVYALGIGIAKYEHEGEGFTNLQFPAKDATEFIRLIDQHRGGRLYGDVETRLLTDEQATRENILDAFDWLVKNVKQGDVVLIFISAHGFHEDLTKFYLATHDVDLKRLRATAIPWDELTTLLHEEIAPSKRMLFLDTCHSGGAQAGQLVLDPTHDMVAPEVGVVVLTSCSPREESLERSDWGHGAFTKAIIDVLSNKDRDISPLPAGDSMFIQSELKLGIIDLVKELTRDRQHPTLSVPPTMREFPVLELSQ
jgi:WD40 repeat protein